MSTRSNNWKINKVTPNKQQNPLLVVIVGETASGKSDLAMNIAERFNGEIISADSLSVYKYFDIGSAKPSKDDQRKLTHHLIDVTDPEKGFSVASFQRLAKAAIQDISNRGKLPIMVGGSGLYIDSVIFDYDFTAPKAGPDREWLNDQTVDRLLGIAKERGLEVDTDNAKNSRRLIRLIESGGAVSSKNDPRDNILLLGLRPAREDQRQRVEDRVEKMIRLGLEQEVKQLSDRFGWEIEPMRGVGYREWRDYFEGRISLDDVVREIIKSNMKLAKKQRTWFRRDVYKSLIQWLDNPSNLDNIVDIITTKMNSKF
jgi:tRNA dimethylallyltransferase